MATGVEPLDITVGPGTPVRVHVTRKPMSNEEALSASLRQYQDNTHRRASKSLRAAGEAYVKHQDENVPLHRDRRVSFAANTCEDQYQSNVRRASAASVPAWTAQESRRSSAAGPTTTAAMQRPPVPSAAPTHAARRVPTTPSAAAAMRNMAGIQMSNAAATTTAESQPRTLHREPFYPPPNLTHKPRAGRMGDASAKSTKPGQGLKQGARPSVGPSSLPGEDLLQTAWETQQQREAQWRFDRAESDKRDLQDRVDQLEQELRVSRSQQDLEQHASQLAAQREELRRRDSMQYSSDRADGPGANSQYSNGAVAATTMPANSANTQNSAGVALPDADELAHGLQRARATREDLVQQLNSYEAANKELRRMLTNLGGGSVSAQTTTSNQGAALHGRYSASGAGSPPGQHPHPSFGDMGTVAGQQGQIAHYEQRLQRLEEDNRRLEHDRRRLQQALEDTQRGSGSSAQLQNSFEVLKRQMKEEKERLQEQLKEKKRQLKERDAELSELVRNGSASISSLAEFRSTVANIEARAAGEKAALKQAHKDTKHRLRHCERALEAVRADLTVRDNQLFEAQTRLEVAEQEAHRLRSELAGAQQQIQQQGQELTEASRVQEAYTALQREHDQLRGQHTTGESLMREERQRLQEEREALTTQLESVRQQLATATAQAGMLERDTAELKRELDAKLTELDHMSRTLDAAQQHQEQVETQLRTRDGEAATAVRRCEELNAKLTELQAQLDAEQTTKMESTRQLETSMAEMRSSLEQERRRAEDALRQAEQRAQAAQADVERTQKDFADRERRYEDQLTDLREKLDYANTARRSLQNYVDYVKSTYSSVFDDPQLAGRA